MRGAKRALVLFWCMVLAAAAGCGKREEHAGGKKGEEILVLCGGSMRKVLEELVDMYKKVSGDVVVTSYGGSGELCAQIQNAGRGDLYICHDPFMEWAAKRGLVSTWDTVGYFDVAIVVPKGNPKNIRSLKDLARPGLRVGIGNRIYSTSGVLVKEMLARLDYGPDIMKNVRAETKGHQQRCTDVILGALDAGIVWYPIALLFKDRLDIIPIPAEYVQSVTSATYGESDLRNVKVTVGILAGKEKRPAVKRFYEFILAHRGVFKRHGFRTRKR